MVFYIVSGMALGLFLYFLGAYWIMRKPEKAKKLAKLGSILAALAFLFRFGPTAAFNLLNLLAMFLPFSLRHRDDNAYSDKQNLAPPPHSAFMTTKEAREVLGVSEEATIPEIKTAFNHLMKKNHPDVGGSKYFTEKLIQARDILLHK